MPMTITGHLIADSEPSEPGDGQRCFRFDVEAEPAYPSILWPAPPETVRVVVSGPVAERVVAGLRAGSRVRAVASSEDGLTLIATRITPLDEPPDTPAIPTDLRVPLKVTRVDAPGSNEV